MLVGRAVAVQAPPIASNLPDGLTAVTIWEYLVQDIGHFEQWRTMTVPILTLVRLKPLIIPPTFGCILHVHSLLDLTADSMSAAFNWRQSNPIRSPRGVEQRMR